MKTIEGSSTATYILGMGGVFRGGLVNEAKRNMYQKHNLGRNQIIANVTLDETQTYILGPIIYFKRNFFFKTITIH